MHKFCRLEDTCLPRPAECQRVAASGLLSWRIGLESALGHEGRIDGVGVPPACCSLSQGQEGISSRFLGGKCRQPAVRERSCLGSCGDRQEKP